MSDVYHVGVVTQLLPQNVFHCRGVMGHTHPAAPEYQVPHSEVEAAKIRERFVACVCACMYVCVDRCVYMCVHIQ